MCVHFGGDVLHRHVLILGLHHERLTFTLIRIPSHTFSVIHHMESGITVIVAFGKYISANYKSYDFKRKILGVEINLEYICSS